MKDRVKKIIGYEKWKLFFERYERTLIPSTLALGFIVDVVTFRSIQIETTFFILGVYVILAGVSIVMLNMVDTNRQEESMQHKKKYAQLIAPLTLQFSFGALLSSSLIFYWFSGALSVSWPIMLLIAFLMTSNEVFRHYYLKPIIQISVFAFILFSLFAFILPFVFNSIEPVFFVYAGIGSSFLTLLFLSFLLRKFEHIRQERLRILLAVFGMFTIMNILYFSNIIPPIPLSLREAGVYHDVKTFSGSYQLAGEREGFIDKFLPGQTIHLQQNNRVYLYAAVFAPTKLNTTLYHRWQFFDEQKNRWIDKDLLSYTITGGRDEGYRGYSFKSGLADGKWRVFVETKRGQVLGRVPFEIISGEVTPDLVLEVR